MIGNIESNERGTGARYNDGKPDYSLLPLLALDEVCNVLMHGQKKYAAWNWAKGMPWSVPYACCMRHMALWQAGEDVDRESGCLHLAHAAMNILMLLQYAKTYQEGDDRAPKGMLMPTQKPVAASDAPPQVYACNREIVRRGDDYISIQRYTQ